MAIPAEPRPSRVDLNCLGSIGVMAGGAEVGAILAQPKRLALLAYLTLARPRGFQPRSSLLALLWPEHDERHARWAVNQAIRYLRTHLGRRVIPSRGRQDVGIDPRMLWCDAVAFEAACEASHWEEALDLYRGELLHGLQVIGCAEFDRWLDAERMRLRALAARAAWALTDAAEEAARFAEGARWARRAVAFSPHDESGVRRLIRLLDQAGDRAGAAQTYREYAGWLRAQLEVDPAPETRALMAQVRSRAQPFTSIDAGSDPRPGKGPVQPAARFSSPPGTPAAASGRRRFRPRITGLAASALFLGVAASWAFWGGEWNPGDGTAGPRALTDGRTLELYREGRDLLTGMTEPAVRQSIYRFNEVIARDSLFAPAHAAVAAAYMLLGRVHGSMDPREAYPLARRAILRAVALDEGLSEAHRLLGLYQLYHGWDWIQAEQAFHRAVRLDPNDPQALSDLAFYLTLVGRYDEVPPLRDRAIALSPSDPIVWADAGTYAMYAGLYDDARAFLDRALEIAPNSHTVLLISGILDAEMGRTARAVASLHRADTLSGHQDIMRGRLGYALALHGDSAAARAILADLKRRAAEPDTPAKAAMAIAVVHIGLAEHDSAFAWLEVGHGRRASNLIRVLRTPAGGRLADDPRYARLLQRLDFHPRVLDPMAAARPERPRAVGPRAALSAGRRR